MDPRNARALAERVLLEMAENLLGFVQPEAEARASDHPWPGAPVKIDPHILLPRLHWLAYNKLLARTTAPTRGGREVSVYHPADVSARRRAIEDLAARKRLLYARYLSWAHGTAPELKGGLVGPASERIVHHCLRSASPAVGYKLLNPETGHTATILDQPVPGGPVDNAAIVHLGTPPRRYILVCEVKSYRSWVYHDESREQLYQVLYKAAALQQLLPDELIVPVLVCRRAHITAFRMVKDLGGFIIDTRRQWVLPRANAHVTEQSVNEVSVELDFDLHIAPENFIDARVLKQFTSVLPAVLPRQAARWRLAGSQFEAEYYDLWHGVYLHPLGALRQQMNGFDWFEGGW